MNSWSIKFSPYAAKQFSKIDKQTQRSISKYLDKILSEGNPYNFGKSLTGNLADLWRYRVGKYRIICKIHNNELIIEVIEVGKRDKIYH